MVNFKKGEFAWLQGQIVEIINITTIVNKYSEEIYMVKVKLLNDNLTHNVPWTKLVKIEDQSTPSILYKNSKEYI